METLSFSKMSWRVYGQGSAVCWCEDTGFTTPEVLHTGHPTGARTVLTGCPERLWWLSHLGEAQKPFGHSARHAALGSPASAGSWTRWLPASPSDLSPAAKCSHTHPPAYPSQRRAPSGFRRRSWSRTSQPAGHNSLVTAQQPYLIEPPAASPTRGPHLGSPGGSAHGGYSQHHKSPHYPPNSSHNAETPQ